MITLADATMPRRSRFGFMFCGCFLLPVLFLATQEATAHPFHVSFAEVDWNSTTGTLEVALKIDPDDLEREVRLHCGRRILLEDKQAVPLVAAYVRDNFSISSTAPQLESLTPSTDDRPATNFQWVGSEITPKSAWLFFEIKSKGSPADLFIQNTLLAHAEQPGNTVLVRAGKRSSTLTFGRRETLRAIRLESRLKDENTEAQREQSTGGNSSL